MQALQPSQTNSQHAHNHHLVEWSRELEIGSSLSTVLRALLTSTDPVLLMCIGVPNVAVTTLHTRNRRLRLVEMLHISHGQQGRIHTVATGHNLSLFADKEQTAILITHHLPIFQLLGARRHQSAIIPIDFDLRHFHITLRCTSRECIGDDLCMRR